MLAVDVELLAHRFTATTFNDRAVAEWPPHPARLYSAMVAAWADDDQPDAAEQAALRWFEALGPPSITCADAGGRVRRAVVTHFVPVNDARALSRDVSGAYQKLLEAEVALGGGADGRSTPKAERDHAKALAKAKADGDAVGRVDDSKEPSSAIVNAGVAVLPELRGKQGRTFPTIRLTGDASATVRYRWAEAEPDETTLAAIDAVLGRVGRLGHSSTFVSCRATTTPVEPEGGGVVTWRTGSEPVRGDGAPEISVRVPATGSLDRLTMQFASHQGREPRSLPSRSAVYVAGMGARRRAAPRSALAGPWRVLTLPRDGRVRLTRTLDVARAVRGALLSGSGDQPPYLLHGHAGSPGVSSSPGSQPHLSVLPLANVGSRFGDGIIHGVALALPAGATQEDHDVLHEALARWAQRSRDAGAAGLVLRLGEHSCELTDRGGDAAGDTKDTLGSVLERRYWARSSHLWASVTPIALDRYPGRANDPLWEERAAASITAACGHVGLPLPEAVDVVWGPPMVGVPAAGPRALRGTQRGARFGGYRAGTSGQVRLCVHARLRFAAAVAGPLVLGAGRFAGYGLFLPIADGEVGG